MLKKFMQIFSPKYFARLSRDCRTTCEIFWRKNLHKFSCECRKLVAAKFWRIYNAKFFATLVRMSCRASVAGRSRVGLEKT